VTYIWLRGTLHRYIIGNVRTTDINTHIFNKCDYSKEQKTIETWSIQHGDETNECI